MSGQWLFIGLVLLLLAIGMLGAKLLETRFSLKPEIARKLVHVYMGTVTLFFPLLFDEVWPVLLIGIISIALVGSLRFVTQLKSSVGTILHRVTRDSYGELFFPLSVVILFVLAHEQPVYYIIPLLILTFADASAALVGTYYGKKNIAKRGEDSKSIEGAVAFFVIAFICTLLPLFIAGAPNPLKAILMALIIGGLAAIIESISYQGNDNLLIPILTYVFLMTHADASLGWFISQLIITLALAIFLFVWNQQGAISRLGIMNALVASYLIIALAGWDWYIAPILFFVFYPILPKLTNEERAQTLTYHHVNSVIAAGLLWLLVGVALQLETHFFSGFLAAFCISFIVSSFARFHYYQHLSKAKAAILAWLKVNICCLVPSLLLYRDALSVSEIVAIALSLIIAVLFAMRYKIKPMTSAEETNNNLFNFSLSFVLSGLVLVVNAYL